MNIYVGNMPYSATEDQLRELFSQYGSVNSVRIITDRDTGRAKGFGFVEMGSKSEGIKAISALDGQDMDGRALKVNESKPRN